MLSFGGTTAQTQEDQRLYLDARLAAVACAECAAEVMVKKNSEHQTSVQWNQDAVARCHEFARLSEEPGGRKVWSTCSRLRAAIDEAVNDGRIEVGAQDGY